MIGVVPCYHQEPFFVCFIKVALYMKQTKAEHAASSGRLQEVKNSDQQLPPKVVAMRELAVY